MKATVILAAAILLAGIQPVLAQTVFLNRSEFRAPQVKPENQQVKPEEPEEHTVIEDRRCDAVVWPRGERPAASLMNIPREPQEPWPPLHCIR